MGRINGTMAMKTAYKKLKPAYGSNRRRAGRLRAKAKAGDGVYKAKMVEHEKVLQRTNFGGMSSLVQYSKEDFFFIDT
jgi:hypothetical protein